MGKSISIGFLSYRITLSRDSKDNIGKSIRSNAKRVAQFDLNGKLLGVFDSIQNAAKQTGASESAIRGCVNGRIKKTRSDKNAREWRDAKIEWVTWEKV